MTCGATYSESGKPCGFEPCAEYVNLLSEKARLEGRCAGLEEGNMRNQEAIKRQDAQLAKVLAENERLRQDRDRLAGIVEKADALADISSALVHSSSSCWADDVENAILPYQEARNG